MANERFTNALRRVPQKVPPVWMMRQAGRYHHHYQKMRERYSFMELCRIPEVAAQVALGPIKDFDFDVSIFFSDLLFPLDALGMGLKYEPGPVLEKPLTAKSLTSLAPVDEAWPRLEFQRQALKATRELLPADKSLIGFVGGFWTLYTYAVEGAHKGALHASKAQPGLYRDFVEILYPLLRRNIELQLEGGAEVVMIFDTAAGELSPLAFSEMCVPWLNDLARAFPGRLGYYSKGTQVFHLRKLQQDEVWAGFGYDHTWDLVEVLPATRAGFVQGNFDQAQLFLPKGEFAAYLRRFFAPFKELTPEQRAGWVCGLGHGVLPRTPEDNVRTFVELVRSEF